MIKFQPFVEIKLLRFNISRLCISRFKTATNNQASGFYWDFIEILLKSIPKKQSWDRDSGSQDFSCLTIRRWYFTEILLGFYWDRSRSRWLTIRPLYVFRYPNDPKVERRWLIFRLILHIAMKLFSLNFSLLTIQLSSIQVLQSKHIYGIFIPKWR